MIHSLGRFPLSYYDLPTISNVGLPPRMLLIGELEFLDDGGFQSTHPDRMRPRKNNKKYTKIIIQLDWIIFLIQLYVYCESPGDFM